MSVDPAAVFRLEAEDLLATLEQTLLDLSANPDDPDPVDGAFRAIHTLKGSGAMFGFRELAAFLHDVETAFDGARTGRVRVTQPLVSAALRAKDHAAALVRGDAEGDDAAGAAILAAFAAACADDAAPGAPSGAPSPAPSVATSADPTAAAFAALAPAAASAEASETAAAGWRIVFRLPAQTLAFGANPALMIAELGELGPCVTVAEEDGYLADPSTLPRERHGQRFTVVLRAACPRAAVEEAFVFVRDEAELSVEPLAPPAPAAAPPPAPAPTPAAATPAADAAPERGGAVAVSQAAATMRVSTARLDAVIDHVGELVIAQARLGQIARVSDDAALKSLAEEIERLAASLRETTMGIRMVPVGALFARFRRLVRDLSAELGKEIELVTSGEETELDKTVIEQLADPLVHLIRNAADHGLETAEARRAAGKPAAGALRLAAAQEGAEVVITLSDDGAGFDTDRIRARAEAVGLIAPDRALPDPEVWKLIFEPGFSTKPAVTELSGRGVGMDVVKRAIEALRGGVELASDPGRGATVRLRLPLTLAIIDGLLVRVGAGRYVIPLGAVEECVELSDHAEAAGTARRFVSIRGRLLPYLVLRELFDEPGPPDPHQKIVVVASGETRVGLVVDQVIGANQTVIKQLSRLHAGLRVFSGATILGDGTAALILDVMHVIGFGQALEARLVGDRRAA
jgi:two-component system chemotaxis sensor kinase CheA